VKRYQKTTAPTEFWMVVHTWLDACGVRTNKNYIKEEITTHPDYPSLLSVIDLLDAGGMAYRAIHSDPSYITDFNYPLLAHIKKPGEERLHLISDAAEWDKQKDITAHWSGIVVYAEKGAHWDNAENNAYNRRETRNSLTGIGFALAGFGLLILSISHTTYLPTSLFGLLSLLGLAFGLFALGAELGFQNPVVKQVCGAVGAGGCEKVLKSRYAKGFAGVSPADAAVLYFSAQYAFFLWSSFEGIDLQSLYVFALAGTAVAVLSVLVQAFTLKQWCALCLGIAGVLILQGGIAVLAISGSQVPVSGGYLPMTIFLAMALICSLILFPVKHLISSNIAYKLKLAELKKWKLDADLFFLQWQQQPETDSTVWDKDLLIGDPHAPVLITVACNPYCGPCSKEHKQLEALLGRVGDKVKVQLRLTFDLEAADDRRSVAARAILQRANVARNNGELRQMLADWFDWMDFGKWAKKWQPDDNADVSRQMRMHSNWIEGSKISYTPTVFINGKRLPGKYSLSDISPLIPQLAEKLEELGAQLFTIKETIREGGTHYRQFRQAYPDGPAATSLQRSFGNDGPCDGRLSARGMGAIEDPRL
jgi:uncharacterized membrane protein/thiol-disulfide isomerase/thioredoxin